MRKPRMFDIDALLLRLGNFYKEQSKMRYYGRQIEAQRILTMAINCGILIRPKRCSSCGGYSKRKRIEGHHPNYKFPLKVKWLCSKCHGLAHREINRRAK